MREIINPCYEYAGFRYQIVSENGRHYAVPIVGQHHAASRDRNKRNALEQFLLENLNES